MPHLAQCCLQWRRKGKELAERNKGGFNYIYYFSLKYLAETYHIMMFKCINSRRWVIKNSQVSGTDLCFAYITSFNPHYNSEGNALFTPISQWGNWCTERMPQVTHPGSKPRPCGPLSVLLTTLESYLCGMDVEAHCKSSWCLRMFKQCNYRRRGRSATRKRFPKPLCDGSFCFNLAGPQWPDIWSDILLDVPVRMFYI